MHAFVTCLLNSSRSKHRDVNVVQLSLQNRGIMTDFKAILAQLLVPFPRLFLWKSVDTIKMVCRQSKIRDCRDTVDDRVSTTALVNTLCHTIKGSAN